MHCNQDMCASRALSASPLTDPFLFFYPQVNTYWNWADVHIADTYADSVAKWSAEGVTVEQCVSFFLFLPCLSELSSPRRARHIEDAFQELGIPSSTQRYTYELATNSVRLTTRTPCVKLLTSPRFLRPFRASTPTPSSPLPRPTALRLSC
jgi:hypothetical protein